ncbi:MAG TPA: hypothetical protein VJ784_03385 [Pyrinomonadaceae bacterium]|jgi:hypothetical protein|nr:hypothetical protein [Pyrinomonadaceae bacterium]
MATNTQITIDSFTGGPNGVDLKECYFEETAPEEFLFFAPGNSPIHLTNGAEFTFDFHGLNWKAAFVYLDSLGIGAGVWSATGRSGRDPEDPETGTFQAQGGPGTGEDLEASASASA